MSSREELEAFAVKVRAAHDAILEHGYKHGETVLGQEKDGLCIGSAMAYGEGRITKRLEVEVWNWPAYAGHHYGLCQDGVRLRVYMNRLGVGTKNATVANWNDQNSHETVLDTLLKVEKVVLDDVSMMEDE